MLFVYREILIISLFTTLLYFLYYALNAYYLMRHKPEPVANNLSHTGDVTILIPVYEENVEVFKGVIERVRMQRTKFVVVGDSSDEPYRSIVEQSGGIFVHLKDRGGKRIAISEGMKRVDTEFVLFVDSDTTIPADTVGKMLQYFKESVGGVGANVTVKRSGSGASYSSEFLERTREVILKAMTARGGSVMVVDGKCAMYRTTLVKPLLLSDKFRNHRVAGKIATMGDDQQLTAHIIKQGYKATKCFDLMVETEPPASFKQFTKQSIRWARSSYYYFLRNLFDGTAVKAGPFYTFEAISTFALPVVTLGIGLLRFYFDVHILGTIVGNSLDTLINSITTLTILTKTRALINPILIALSLPGPVLFGSAIVSNVRKERLKTLAYGGVALLIIFFTSVYGFLTCWKQSKWMTR